MDIIDIDRYTLPPWGASNGIKDIEFKLGPGEVIAITLDTPDDGILFLKALATLIAPIQGSYRFQGQPLEFGDYRKLLPIKRKIGYVGADAALISNRTVLENLLLMRYYFENTLTIKLDDTLETLCRQCGLYDKLGLRPADLNPLDLQIGIYLRELAKKPVILLLDRPEEFMIPSTNSESLITHFKELMANGLPVVMLSYDPGFIDRFATKVIQIRQGQITENPFGNISRES